MSFVHADMDFVVRRGLLLNVGLIWNLVVFTLAPDSPRMQDSELNQERL